MKKLKNKNAVSRFADYGASNFGETYEPPYIEVVEFKVEKGFADSTTDFGEETW